MITVLGRKLATAELEGIPVERPKNAGNRWRGLAHHDLAHALEGALGERGIGTSGVAWTLGKNDQALYGGMNLQFPAGLDMPELAGLQYALGVRHANDMSCSIQFFAGLQVMICSNGVATGAFILARKHTNGIDLQQEVRCGVERLIEEARKAGGVVERMQERRLSQTQVDHMLCEAGRRRLLSWGHLGLVEREYRAPTHAEFSDRNAWALYNSFNHVAKRIAPGRQLKALDGFREVVLN